MDASAAKRAARKAMKSAKPKSFVASILPYVVLVVLIAVAVNQFYLQSPSSAKKAARNESSYLSRSEVVDRKRFDIPCHMRKVRISFSHHLLVCAC